MLVVVAAVLLNKAQAEYLHHLLRVAVALVAVAQVSKQHQVRVVTVQTEAQTLAAVAVDQHQDQL
jgi:hypothetical protein